ncbi:carbohydrate kinase family protein [Humibacter antri]
MRTASGRVLVCGDVIDDVIVRPLARVRTDTDTAAEIRSRPGGSGANVAAWLGAEGAAVDFVGCVGADDVARHGAELERFGVRPLLAVSDTEPTGTIVILVEGESRTMLTERGANAMLTASDVPPSALNDAALLHLSGYSVLNRAGDGDTFAGLISRANRLGVPVSVDPGSAGFIRDHGRNTFLAAIGGATILLPNADEAIALSGVDDPVAATQWLGDAFPLVVTTMGADGAVVVQNGGSPTLVPVDAVHAFDPTGAGDSFDAGFLAAWLGGAGLIDAARHGFECAARSLAQPGGRPTIPDARHETDPTPGLANLEQ